MKRPKCAVLVAIATLVISFVLTIFLYLKCEDWFNPDPGSMAAMGALILALVVAPICALIAGGLVFWWSRKDSIPK